MSARALSLLVFAVAPLLSARGATGEKVDFNYDIRPIISANCYHCHGPDEESRKAKLRLDLREEAIKDRDGFTAIVPGNPEASELLLRVVSTDPDEVMPPPKEGHALTEQEVELLRRWIAQGAEYKPHWSFSKPQRPEVPASADGKPFRHPIDAFIGSRLSSEGLKLSPEADRHTLIRRVSLDLIGLPPTREEIQAFVADESADAYQKVVDRLLASPAYGERWAKMWLDLARFADSTGYGSDKFRLNIWPYRDWVIDAFNRNVPYDQFTTEQLAGDLLPSASREQIAATAFHRNTMTNVEGGTIDEEYRVAAVKDRIATTSQVWMGLTMQCAQCHTHKFDPISHEEYYQFFAIFNQTEDSDREDEEPKLPLPTREEQAKMDSLKQEIATLEKQSAQQTPELALEQSAWEAEMLRPIDWTPLQPFEMKSSNEAKLILREDGSVFAEGGGAFDATYTIKAQSGGKSLTAFRLEALPDPALPAHGPGRGKDGKAYLTELRVTASSVEKKPVAGRFVRVELPGEGRMLALAEVEAFSAGRNVAVKGRATQSSVDYGGGPELAVDGRTDGDYTKAKSTSHTANEKNPWWEVDLGSDLPLDRVVVWNRTDGGLGSRLADARVKILDANRKEVGNFILGQSPPTMTELLPGIQEKVIAFRSASADREADGFSASAAIDGKSESRNGWGFGAEVGKPHAIVFEAEEALGNDEVLLTFKLEQKYGENHTFGRFRLSGTSAALPVRELPPEVRTALSIEESARDEAQKKTLSAYFRPLSKTVGPVYAELAKKRGELAAIKPVALPILRELAAEKRRQTHLMNKGNYLSPGQPVKPSLPVAFASFVPPEQAQSRLDVARWLFHPENPLTARVTVNRFWAQLFGTGLVATEEDFGTQGSLPSHPELLDWLAVTFSAPKAEGLGWDVKALLRLIVMSDTYRQSSRTTPELLEKDARNILLARYPRRRLDAEAVRDQALQISGLLSRKIGGRSVYPPQPPGLWNVAFNGGQNDYPTSKGEDRYRRGIYTFWRRTMPHPAMSTFDAPSRESCTLRRTPTNTPLQAFVTMNDPVFVEASQALARRIVGEGGGDLRSRLQFGLELAMGRSAEAAQIDALSKLYEEELHHYRGNAEAATKLATEPLGPLPQGIDAAEMAAWTVVANVLLNLDGVLMKG